VIYPGRTNTSYPEAKTAKAIYYIIVAHFIREVNFWINLQHFLYMCIAYNPTEGVIDLMSTVLRPSTFFAIRIKSQTLSMR